MQAADDGAPGSPSPHHRVWLDNLDGPVPVVTPAPGPNGPDTRRARLTGADGSVGWPRRGAVTCSGFVDQTCCPVVRGKGVPG
jgi:hypothetical protein